MNAMNKFKKALSFMLVLILVATLLPVPARAAVNLEDSYAENYRSCTKVTKFTSGNTYVITVYYARKYYALVHTGERLSAVQVQISNGKVKTPVTDGMLWNYKGGVLSYEHEGETYNLYSGNSQSWWGDGTGKMPLAADATRSSAVSLNGNKLKVGAYYLCFTDGTIKGNVNAGMSYIFEQAVE